MQTSIGTEPDHWLKLRWAAKHIDTFSAMLQEFLGSSPWEFETTRTDNGYYVATCVRADPLPRAFGLVLGDAIHNLRSSLDAVAYALATHHLRRTLTLSEALSIQFPIVDRASDWRGQEKRWLHHLSSTAHAAICALQPFNQTVTNWAESIARLRDLSNADKHRHVSVVLSSPEVTTMVVTVEGQRPFAVPGAHYGALSVGTEIARWKFADGYVPPGSQPSCAPLVVPGVEFDRTVHGYDGSVPHFLVSAHNAIRDHVFPPLDAILSY